MLSPTALQLFEQYCNLDTSLKSGKHYQDVLDLFQPILENIGFDTVRIPIPQEVAHAKNRVNLVASLTKDASLPTLMIYNHIDVVPAEYQDAFTFKIENNRAYARGAADHKGSTVAIIDALLSLQKDQLRFNLLFLLTTDEETYQTPQLEYLQEKLNINPKNTLCFDPDTFAGGITNSHLGIYQFTISAQGKATHSGMSNLGVNAVEGILSLQPTLEKISQKYQDFKSTATSFPKDGMSERVRSSFNCNVISGGSAKNIVPDQASLSIDVRLSPELELHKEKEWIKKELTKAFAQHQANFEITDGATYEGYISSHPEIDRLEMILEKHSGDKGQYCVQGSTPVAQWTKNMGIAHFGLGVARYDSNVHGVNENCHLEDVETLRDVFLEFIQ